MRGVHALAAPSVPLIASSEHDQPKSRHHERLSLFERHRIVDATAQLAIYLYLYAHIKNPQVLSHLSDSFDTEFELLDTDPVAEYDRPADTIKLSDTIRDILQVEGRTVFIDEHRVRAGMQYGEFAVLTWRRRDVSGETYETTSLYTPYNTPSTGFGSHPEILRMMLDQGMTLPTADSELSLMSTEDVMMSTLDDNYVPVNGYGTLADTDDSAEIWLKLYDLRLGETAQVKAGAHIQVNSLTPARVPAMMMRQVYDGSTMMQPQLSPSFTQTPLISY